MQLSIASLDTTHFQFLAVGMTEAEAEKNLLKGLRLHEKEFGKGIIRNYRDAIRTTDAGSLGETFRDGITLRKRVV